MQQESTTTHFTLGFICIFVNSDSPTGAAVYFSQKVSIYMTFDICGGIFIHLKFPHWIISYSTNLKWSENKHRSHENICSNECRESWCLHHKCLKWTWKLTFSLFLPKGGNLFAGSGKITLVWPFEYLPNPIFLPPEVRGSRKADMSPHIPTPQTFRTFQFHFWKGE